MYSKDQPTDSQRAAMVKAADRLDEGFAEARATLTAAGIEFPGDGRNCLRGDGCPDYTRPSGSPGLGPCATPGCGHHFSSHNII